MNAFWDNFAAIEREAAQTTDGKAFLASGFKLYPNGGGLTAWRKDIDEKRYILVTDSEGCSHELSSNGHAVNEGSADEFLIGVHSSEGDEDERYETAATAAEAIAIAEKLA